MSPKVPRDVSGKKLVKVLSKHGYEVARQTGSHIRLTISTIDGVYAVTVPNHDSLKLGTLMAILNDVATQLKINKEELLNEL